MAVKLTNHLGIEYEFISMARASKFLGRCHGYVSDRLKTGHEQLTDINGNYFKAESWFKWLKSKTISLKMTAQQQSLSRVPS